MTVCPCCVAAKLGSAVNATSMSEGRKNESYLLLGMLVLKYVL